MALLRNCALAPASNARLKHAITLPHARIGGKVAVSNQRADTQAAIGGLFDLVERQAVDIDQIATASRPAASSGRADWCRRQ